MDYEVIGFNKDGKCVIFKKNGKTYFLKSNLSKSDLISYLDISPIKINKELRDEILEEARKHGRLRYAYHDGDGIWKKFDSELDLSRKSTYSRLIPVDEWEKIKWNWID